ncbi:MAG: hypothetical protein IKQ91_00735 [Oscillospiraceae bacterium]|nr:hypothetical protein [Oscillospiraceae bacterium]
MLDIMRFQFRQLFRARMVHLTNILMLTVFLVMLFLDSGNHGDVREMMTSYLPQTLPFITGISVFAPAIMIAMVCGADFEDKTINHELTGGRSRTASFFGRAVPVMIAAPLTTVFITALPYVIYAAAAGTGDAIPVSAIAERYLLMLFPLLRLSAFFVFLIFVTKKQLAVIVSSLLVTSVTLGIIDGSGRAVLIQVINRHAGMLSISDLTRLTRFDNWRAYDLTMHSFYTYYPQLPVSQIVLTVICSLGMAAVWLLLGWHFFHVDDMN